MKKKFAFLLMGSHYRPEIHQACFETENQVTYLRTVRNFDEACETVKWLEKEGVGALELCGAFGEEGARKLICLTQNRIAIGYVTHFSEQNSLFQQFFSDFSEES